MSQDNRLFLVMDAWIIATTKDRDPRCDEVWKAAEVMSKILRICHKIVLDCDGTRETILDEYERVAKGSQFAQQWLIAMKTKGKFVYRSRSVVTFQALTDVDDLKYLQTAMNSPHKKIITGDSDLLTIADDHRIRAEGIDIWSLDEALAKL